MTKYLLTCQCGQRVAVETGQAGEKVTCDCGAALDVPPLRQLRHKPVAAAAGEQEASTWSPRRGLITACVILGIVLAAVALSNRLTEPVVEPFNAASRAQVVEQGLEELTPAQAWQAWIQSYRPLAETGFRVFEHPHAAAIEEEIVRRRFLQRTLFVTAGVLGAVAILAAFWPTAKTRRIR